MSQNRISVDPSGFLTIDGRKMPVKVTPTGKLEFCDKSAAHRHRQSRFVIITATELAAGVRRATGTGSPERVEIS